MSETSGSGGYGDRQGKRHAGIFLDDQSSSSGTATPTQRSQSKGYLQRPATPEEIEDEVDQDALEEMMRDLQLDVPLPETSDQSCSGITSKALDNRNSTVLPPVLPQHFNLASQSVQSRQSQESGRRGHAGLGIDPSARRIGASGTTPKKVDEANEELARLTRAWKEPQTSKQSFPADWPLSNTVVQNLEAASHDDDQVDLEELHAFSVENFGEQYLGDTSPGTMGSNVHLPNSSGSFGSNLSQGTHEVAGNASTRLTSRTSHRSPILGHDTYPPLHSYQSRHDDRSGVPPISELRLPARHILNVSQERSAPSGRLAESAVYGSGRDTTATTSFGRPSVGGSNTEAQRRVGFSASVETIEPAEPAAQVFEESEGESVTSSRGSKSKRTRILERAARTARRIWNQGSRRGQRNRGSAEGGDSRWFD